MVSSLSLSLVSLRAGFPLLPPWLPGRVNRASVSLLCCFLRAPPTLLLLMPRNSGGSGWVYCSSSNPCGFCTAPSRKCHRSAGSETVPVPHDAVAAAPPGDAFAARPEPTVTRAFSGLAVLQGCCPSVQFFCSI
jgi:hypothetical protein